MLLYNCLIMHYKSIAIVLGVIFLVTLITILLKIGISRLVVLCHNKYDHIIFWSWRSFLIPVAIVFSVIVGYNISGWTKSDAVPGVKYCEGHNNMPNINCQEFGPVRSKTCCICHLPYMSTHYDYASMSFILALTFILFWVYHARKTTPWVGLWCTLLQWIIVISLMAGVIILIFIGQCLAQGGKKEKE